MKRSIILSLLLISSAGLFAQTGVHIGGGLIPQNTWIFNRTDTDVSREEFSYQPTFGYGAHFKLGYNFVPVIGLHTGAIYSFEGQNHETVDSLGNSVDVRRRQTYLKIPVFAHFGSNPARAMFNFGVGLYYAWLLNASEEYEAVNGTVSTPPVGADQTVLFSENVLGFAWYIGGDFQLGDSPTFLNLHLRGDYGIWDTENKELEVNGNLYYPESRAISNNVTIGISVGITYVIETGGGGAGQYWIR